MSSLTVSRRKGESILVGKDIKITFTGFNGAQARIKIEAPREILILREELEHFTNSQRERGEEK